MSKDVDIEKRFERLEQQLEVLDSLKQENADLKRQLLGSRSQTSEQAYNEADTIINRSRAKALRGRYEWRVIPAPHGLVDNKGRRLYYPLELVHRSNSKDKQTALSELNVRLTTNFESNGVKMLAVGFEPDGYVHQEESKLSGAELIEA